MPLDLRLIRHAVALAQHRHFMRAAKSQHVSQPTLSRNIAMLEQTLGVRLFDRKPDGVEPTAFGRTLIERGRELLAGEADLLREITLQAGLELGTLAVSAGPYPFETAVAEALARLIQTHPRLTVTATMVHARDVIRAVLDGQVDVGIADASVAGRQERLQVEPLPAHDIFLACRVGHPLLKKGHLTPADVAAYPIASTDVVGNLSRLLAGLVKTAGLKSGRVDPDSGDFIPAITVNSQYLARKIASGSDAVVAGTAAMLAPDLDAGRLVTLDIHIPELRVGYGILTLKGRTPSPSALKLINLLREVEAERVQAESSPQVHGHRRKRVTLARRRS